VADLTLLIFIAVDSLYVYMCMYLQHYNAFTVLLLCKFLFYFFFRIFICNLQEQFLAYWCLILVPFTILPFFWRFHYYISYCALCV